MTRTIEAIFENGVFRPIEPLVGVNEHEKVMVTFTAPETARPLMGWKGGLSNDDALTMQQVIAEEFERLNPDEWK
jgi:predicted DNA-binding antitoxin AbrB/MazE fold protein